MPKTHPEYEGDPVSSSSSVEWVSQSLGSSGNSGGVNDAIVSAFAKRGQQQVSGGAAAVLPAPGPGVPPASAGTSAEPKPAGADGGEQGDEEAPAAMWAPTRTRRSRFGGGIKGSDVRRDSMWGVKAIDSQGLEFISALPIPERLLFNAIMIAAGVFIFATTVFGFSPNVKYAAETGTWAHMSYTDDTLRECPPQPSLNIGVHAVSAILWLLLSTAQVATGATGRKGQGRRRWHKFSGRYVAPPVLLVQLGTAFVAAANSHASWFIQCSLFMLGVTMLALLVHGVRAVLARDYFEHKECMMDLLLLGTGPAMQRLIEHMLAAWFPGLSRVHRQGATWIVAPLILAVTKLVMTIRLQRMHILRNKIMIVFWFLFVSLFIVVRLTPSLHHLLQLCENTLKEA